MTNVPDYFGSLVFDDRAMKEHLSKDVYKSLKKTVDQGQQLDIGVANAVAAAMRDWAVEKGATHFTHWFQPLTGITAEKHDGFIAPDGSGVIMDFSGKELIKGEPDASSFPSGGLRATFEARGYTAWDPTSYAFIKDKTLCIPTAFCSYSGEALDKKTPLLRSMEAVSRESVRILKLMGISEVKRVVPCVGPEQEYFLIDKEVYEKRPDLVFTGRTLFGAAAPKGQELDDHYFGSIKPRVAEFMAELNEELWKHGVLAKTEHNEVAPAQHELAPIYTTANIATDHNQLTMELMKKIAPKHGMVCLLAEKPFAGVNGSGKHNNWSLSTDTGMNLLSPSENPADNEVFLLFLAAVIKAVDKYQDLLRLSVATAGNDHRLGANEAPPAIVSMFVGDELEEVLKSIESSKHYSGSARKEMALGVTTLPKFLRDNTDRNRTSPFAFTGNKFEFRMVGSSDSIACANIMINSAVASVLKEFADKLETAGDFDKTYHDIIKKTIKDHRRIIFNGNGYDESWVKEAEKRGLSNLRTTADAMPRLLDKKNADMLKAMGVFSDAELASRCEIMLDNYCKTVSIEAHTMLYMVRKDILPAVEKYMRRLAGCMAEKKGLGIKLSTKSEEAVLKKLSKLADSIMDSADALESVSVKNAGMSDVLKRSADIRDKVIPAMESLREAVDSAELITAKECWPYPDYGDLLYSVK